MATTTRQESRDRLLAFVAMLRAAVRLDPSRGFTQLADVAGIGPKNGQYLIELGVISVDEKTKRKRWVSQMTDEQIVDMVITHRRQADAPLSAGESPDVADLAQKVERLIEIVSDLSRPQPAPASQEALVKLAGAVTDIGHIVPLKCDVERSETRIKQLEEMQNLILIEVDGLRKRLDSPSGAGRVVPFVAEQTSGEHSRSPQPRPKRRFALVGFFPAQMTFIEKSVLGVSGVEKYDVELRLIDHQTKNFAIPRGYDAVFCSDLADMKFKEIRQIYQDAAIKVPHGVKSVATSVANFLTERAA